MVEDRAGRVFCYMGVAVRGCPRLGMCNLAVPGKK
jgi:hypothetical protein